METTVTNATEYRNVSLSLLTESKTNPRRTFEDAALQELAASIRAQGVLSPLLVRPLNERSFEAGVCREGEDREGPSLRTKNY
ncbi:ParB N-terminal domain-containing protein [Granulicella sp. WH15]|uniref:ParB/RepB/Spo0J family partition protein n=1 Tax=Granulicella sp. WH15 TaxID=2602070 RepID=UPI0023DE15C1|nr:ParB N-terminal domain-containing protein [Granulicella sp. WH15]